MTKMADTPISKGVILKRPISVHSTSVRNPFYGTWQLCLHTVSDDRYWIGAYHTPSNPNDWHWVDGSSLSTTHHMWAANEPNNSNEECAEILFFAGVLSANNHLCDRTYKYVCSMSEA